MSKVGPKVLLVVGGGIAAYKSCELVRLIRKAGGDVTCVITKGGQQFVTPLSLAALSENQVYTTLWDLKNEAEMGHIQLSREADVVVVCPATADLLAKMATGIADDLATTLILATDKPVIAVPAMNVRMWEHDTTQRNIARLQQANVNVLHPDQGAMACGEFGYGRLPEPEVIWAEIARQLGIEVPAADTAGPASAALMGGEYEDDPIFEDGEALIVDPLAEARMPGNEPAPDEGYADAYEADDAVGEEPEEEQPAEETASGLSGLLSRLIPRSTAKRSHDEIEADYQDVEPFDPGELPPLGDEAMADGDAPAEGLPPPGESPGPLLASKGGAAAAPPINADAINHEVNPRQSAPEAIEPVQAAAVESALEDAAGPNAFNIPPDYRPLDGRHVLITAGPTWEAIDPVRYIANRSSGKQGFAIAAAAAALGARVTLVAGPVALKTPAGVDRIDVESAAEMNEAVRASLPADAAVMVAAVADWRPRDYTSEKIKKRGSAPPAIILTENPDILSNLAGSQARPPLVIGFAAETENLLENAAVKRQRKAADWIIANDVSGDVMGGEENEVHIVTSDGVEQLEKMAKADVALALAQRIADSLQAEAAE